MTGDVSPYLSRVPNENASQPKFIATLTATLQPLADNIAILESMPGLYDLDAAVGVQLDAVGLWVGAPRTIQTALPNVWFTFNTPGLGFNQGVWRGNFDPTTGATVLGDDVYRLYLRAVIGADHWDGTIPGAHAVLDPLLAPGGTGITIQDNGDMTMTVAFTGTPPTPIIAALFTNGYIQFRPPGVTQIGP